MTQFRNQKNALLQLPFVAGDVETTGLRPDQGDRIGEIALLKFCGGKIVDSLVTLVNPGRPIPPEATQINGISDEMVADAAPFPEVAAKIAEFLRGKPLAFHTAPFDLSFLHPQMKDAGVPFPGVPVIDTLETARSTGRWKNHKLSELCRTFGISSEWHRARSDAFATGMLLMELAKDPRAVLNVRSNGVHR